MPDRVAVRLFLSMKKRRDQVSERAGDRMNYKENRMNECEGEHPLSFFGCGMSPGNDLSGTARRRLSQSLVYLCRAKEKTADELARETGIPASYIEEELEMLCRGVNGQYGLLRKNEQGMYIANIIIADREEYEVVNGIYRRYVTTFCDLLQDCLIDEEKELRSFWRRNLRGETDLNLLLWALMPDITGNFISHVGEESAFAFPETAVRERPFTVTAAADLGDENCFYGCDSICANNVCGYSNIMARNFHGKRLQAHFRCGHDLASDPLLRLTAHCAEGVPLWSLPIEGQEVAGRALRRGYLRLRQEILEPAVVVLADGISVYIEFQSLLGKLDERAREMARLLGRELGGVMEKYIPPHLRGDYPYYNSCIAANRFAHEVVEECIYRGILKEPGDFPGPEGVLMVLCV